MCVARRKLGGVNYNPQASGGCCGEWAVEMVMIAGLKAWPVMRTSKLLPSMSAPPSRLGKLESHVLHC